MTETRAQLAQRVVFLNQANRQLARKLKAAEAELARVREAEIGNTLARDRVAKITAQRNERASTAAYET